MNIRNLRFFASGIPALFLSAHMAAAPSRLPLDVPAGPLLGCLEHLAAAANVRIIDRDNRAATTNCHALRADLTLDQALDRLLQPLRWQWRRLEDGTIEIFATASAALDLPELTIEGAPLPEVERPGGPAPTVLAEQASALTRLGREWLETAPWLGFNQIGRYAPNVYGTGQGLSIRGMERDSDYLTSLSITLDGIDLGTRLLDDELVPLDDVVRLDLARGPRSFEAGRASAAGAIRLVTAPPAAEPTLRTTVGVSDQGAWRESLSWSGPLTDSGLGATTLVERHAVPDFLQQRYAPEADIHHRLNGSARLKLRYEASDTRGPTAELAILNISGDSSDRWIEPTWISTPGTPFGRDSYAEHPVLAHTHALGTAATLRYPATDALTLEMHGAYTSIQRDGNAYPSTARTEANLENRRRAGASIQARPEESWVLAAGLDVASAMMRERNYYDGPRYASTNFYAQTWSAWTWLEHAWGHAWNAGLGLRWLTERTHSGPTYSDPEMESLQDTSINRLPVPLGVIEWRPWPGHVLSLSHGRGYRSGGNYDLGKTYGAEDDRSSELSWRAGWLGGNLTTRATLFDSAAYDRFAWSATHRAQASTRGVEFEMEVVPSPMWRLRGGFGLLDSRYIRLQFGSRDLSDKRTPGSPSRTATLGLRAGYATGWYMAADAYHASAAETGQLNAPRLRRQAYTLLDVGVGYRMTAWDTSLTVTNALDENYIDRAEEFVPGMATGVRARFRLGDPRRIEWRVSRSW